MHLFNQVGSITSPHWEEDQVGEQFEVAYIDDKHEWIPDTRKDQIREWAKNKTAPATGGNGGQSKLYQPMVDKNEMRVLEVKPGRFSDQLKGMLHHCSLEFEGEASFLASWRRHALSMNNLSTPISYTALSYTWGPPIFDTRFECNGHVKMITSSLASALRQLRQKDKAVVLWVDQICIDQENNEEKAQQIPLMSKIYTTARNTAIWLGSPADNSFRALKILKDAKVCLQFSPETVVDPGDFERMGLPKPDSDDWRALWKLLSRPWFERLWIIQELALSSYTRVFCGKSFIEWETISVACDQLEHTGISQWLTQKFSSSEGQEGDWYTRDLCKQILNLDRPRSTRDINVKAPTLLDSMIDTRRAKCYDHRDKVYGMFGICDPDYISRVRVDYSSTYPVEQLFQDILEDHIAGDATYKSWPLDRILPVVDHDSENLPSWVADWRRNRRTTALGSGMFSYCTDGRLTPRFERSMIVVKVDSSDPSWKELQVAGLSFSNLETLSEVFENPDLSTTGRENRTLQMMLQFIVNLKHYPSPNIDFSAFWQTLVAGKDEHKRLICPDAFAEIFSYTLDLATGKKDSISGQTYTRRQGLPKGRGGLDGDKFESRKPRSIGETFRNARTAMINATKNRRLGATANGHIGLFPEHSQPGDGVFVIMGCNVPCVLRPRGDKKFKFIGECYVHGIMFGEAVGPNQGLQDITLV